MNCGKVSTPQFYMRKRFSDAGEPNSFEGKFTVERALEIKAKCPKNYGLMFSRIYEIYSTWKAMTVSDFCINYINLYTGIWEFNYEDYNDGDFRKCIEKSSLYESQKKELYKLIESGWEGKSLASTFEIINFFTLLGLEIDAEELIKYYDILLHDLYQFHQR